MKRIYLASSWRNADQPALVYTLRQQGHLVYDFRNPPHATGFSWSQVDPLYKTWSAETYRAAMEGNARIAQGFMSDFRAMQWADVCVLLLPCGRSAHLEAGWFCGAGKPCHILTRDGEEPELMSLLATTICVSVGELLEALR